MPQESEEKNRNFSDDNDSDDGINWMFIVLSILVSFLIVGAIIFALNFLI